MRYITIIILILYQSPMAIAQWMGQTSSSDLTSLIYRTGVVAIDGYNSAQIRLNSTGTYYGKIGNPTPQVWSLGWGGSGTDINSALSWTATGYVGIGTYQPSTNLHIANSNNGGLRIGKVGDAGNTAVPVGAQTLQYNLDFSGYRDMSPDQIGARIAALRFNGYNDNAAFRQTTGLAFYTNPSGQNNGNIDLQERMRISPDGNVGIGTTAPASRFHIADGNGGEQLRITRGTGAVRFAQDLNQDNLYLYNKDASLIYMFWRPNGNVGIGTDQPSTNLHIANSSNGGLRIGKVGDAGNTAVAIGAQTLQYNLDFSGYRDMSPDQIGARIAALRFNGYIDNAALRQTTGLAFYTNPSGQNNGNTDLQERMRISPDGNVGIGTATPGSFKLAVNGKIWATEVQVALTNPGPDYVFEKNYDLLSLEEIKTYIEKNKHLPDVPSAKEMQTNGINLSEMNMLFLKKIEELTLHMIQQNEMIRLQNQRISQLENQKR